MLGFCGGTIDNSTFGQAICAGNGGVHVVPPAPQLVAEQLKAPSSAIAKTAAMVEDHASQGLKVEIQLVSIREFK